MMIKRPLLYILSFVLLLACEVEISDKQATTFIKFYGNYLLDAGFDVVSNDNGGFAIAGTSEIPDSVSVMSLLLTDKFGNLLNGYPKYYTDGRNCGANTIVKLNDGFLLCGYIVEEGGGEFQDIYIVRTTTEGEVIWAETYGVENENENVSHVIKGNTDGFLVAGYKESNKKKDYWIFSIKDDGEFVREVPPQPIPDTEDDLANYLINISGQGYLCVCTYDEDTYDGTNVFILSINNDLNSPYNLSLGTDFDDFGKCIIREDDDSFYVLGNTENGSSGKSEIYVYRVEMDGLMFENSSIVATIESGFEDLIAERFVLTETGRLAIIGSGVVNEDYNILLQFIDQGTPSDRVYFGETGTQIGSGIIISDDGGLIFVGANAFEGNSMIALIKTNENGQL